MRRKILYVDPPMNFKIDLSKFWNNHHYHKVTSYIYREEACSVAEKNIWRISLYRAL